MKMNRSEWNDHTIQGRMFGLDVCRTIAILPVVFGHMLGHSYPNAFVRLIGSFGGYGVDLFFCLSGFLIGRILLLSAKTWRDSQQNGVASFLYRRWMRTLPVYFFYL